MMNEIFTPQNEVEPAIGSLLEKLDQIELERGMPEPPLEISEEEAKNDVSLGELKREYDLEESNSLVRKVVVSILCHMRTHNKIALAISYKRMRFIYQSDPNWKNHARFEDGTFLNVCAMLNDLGIKRIVKHDRFRPGIVFAYDYSPIAKSFTGDLEEELCGIFKILKITENDFVDDAIGNVFKRFLPK